VRIVAREDKGWRGWGKVVRAAVKGLVVSFSGVAEAIFGMSLFGGLVVGG